jgi:hypothetical protein
MSIRLVLAALAVATIAVLPARAQDIAAAHLAAGREFVEAKGAVAAFDTAIPGIIDQVRGNFLQTNPDLGKPLTEVATALRTEFGPRRAEIVTILARSYALRFSEAELKEGVAFYRTPLGRKLVAEEPTVVDESFNRLQDWSNRIAEEIISRMRAEMKKRGFTL